MRSIRENLLLAAKGMLMGAADAVPGVSGGTIAFITGIYEELIESLRRFDLRALRLLFQAGPAACWRHVNGNFLLVLLLGIGLSLVSLAHGVLYLLEHQPVLLWSFFFGLITASVWSLVRHVQGWDTLTSLVFCSGALGSWLITAMVPAALTPTPLALVGAGMVAICAMILPGISGSFILLLMGLYAPILNAIRQFELLTLGLFASGCALGLIAFSRAVSWAFHHQRRLTLALLGGFLLGSLNKVWPWKYTLSYTLDHRGDMVPLMQRNLLPEAFVQATGQPSLLLPALALMALGMLLVLLLDRHNR